MATKTSTPKNDRAAPAFYVLRALAIHFAAKDGMKTNEIAEKLGVNRSYVIRQTTLALKPRTPAERRIAKFAANYEAQIKRAGFGGLLSGDDVVTTLAGGERPKLGPLAERRAAKAKKTPKAKAKTAGKAVKKLVKKTVKAVMEPNAIAAVKVKKGKPVKVKAAPKSAPAPAGDAPTKPKRIRAPKPPKAAKESPAAQPELPVGPSAAEIMGTEPENGSDDAAEAV